MAKTTKPARIAIPDEKAALRSRVALRDYATQQAQLAELSLTQYVKQCAEMLGVNPDDYDVDLDQPAFVLKKEK